MLKYKDLEALAARQSEVWAPDGTPNLYAFARSSGHITWVVRIVLAGKRTNITIGNWPAVKAEAARAVAATVKGLVKAGHGVQAIRNALAITLEPRALTQLVRGERVSSKNATPIFAEVATKGSKNMPAVGFRMPTTLGKCFSRCAIMPFPHLVKGR